jgi:glucose-6-phosphate 1-dehydrogenase
MKKNKVLPVSIVIFGAKGDLTKRKLIPALYNLFLSNHLSVWFTIICVDFITIDKTDFKNELLEGINEFSRNGKADKNTWDQFSAHLHYLQGDFMNAATYSHLKEYLSRFDRQNNKPGIRLFYFAVSPRFIEPIAEALYHQKLCSQPTRHRMVIEKPFGADLASAQQLNRFLQKRFEEKQLYRIDHYLGKETVQNILAFRFANYVFEPLWNRRYIDHVQVSVAEQVSVGKRGGYYDSSGAMRDMIQNHLLQLLCVVAMEPPAQYKPETIRDCKARLLKQIRLLKPADVFKNTVRAQYSSGEMNGNHQQSYHQEEKVNPSSTTETYAALKLSINNNRWKGVPFFLRTGKSLKRQSSVIIIQFKNSPNKIFSDDIVPNRLVISIQPELEISLLFESKVPGLEMKLIPVEMDFTYKESHTAPIPEAYETLLLDALEGDATLFMRADQVEAAWKVVMPVLDAWKKHPRKQLLSYKPGTWGPASSAKLLKPYATDWLLLPGIE